MTRPSYYYYYYYYPTKQNFNVTFLIMGREGGRPFLAESRVSGDFCIITTLYYPTGEEEEEEAGHNNILRLFYLVHFPKEVKP